MKKNILKPLFKSVLLIKSSPQLYLLDLFFTLLLILFQSNTFFLFISMVLLIGWTGCKFHLIQNIEENRKGNVVMLFKASWLTIQQSLMFFVVLACLIIILLMFYSQMVSPLSLSNPAFLLVGHYAAQFVISVFLLTLIISVQKTLSLLASLPKSFNFILRNIFVFFCFWTTHNVITLLSSKLDIWQISLFITHATQFFFSIYLWFYYKLVK